MTAAGSGGEIKTSMTRTVGKTTVVGDDVIRYDEDTILQYQGSCTTGIKEEEPTY